MGLERDKIKGEILKNYDTELQVLQKIGRTNQLFNKLDS
jgi:hypothetical protein